MINLVGVVVALEEEAAPFLKKIDAVKKGSIFYGNYKEADFLACISGYGKIMAASATQHLIDITGGKLDYLVHFGTAGGLDNSLNIGDLIIPKEIIEYDVRFGLNLNSREHRIVICNQHADKFAQALNSRRGIILSGDRDVTDSKTKKRLRIKYNALSADWESYAVAKVCELNKVPCVVLRAISDNADESASKSFEDNLNKISIDLAKKVLSVF